ncbi:MAG TPA: 2-dehydropantoate 2-reductase N-terminal domain-containing protein [Kofleriaceae bacterium]|jgi:2-dehydropantoate 2-reductase
MVKTLSSPAGRPRGEHVEDGPRIAIFGAGAIGCYVGGRLAAGGAKVTLIGRPRVLDELSSGLTVSDLDGDRYTVKVPTTSDHAAARDAEIVLVTVKSAQSAGAGQALARVGLSSTTKVVSLQNGVRNAEAIEKSLNTKPRPATRSDESGLHSLKTSSGAPTNGVPKVDSGPVKIETGPVPVPKHVAMGMVPWNVVRRGPGAYHRGSSGVLMVEHDDGLEPLYRALTHAGIAFETRHDMAAVQWAKLLMNLNNAVNALSGLPLKDELGQRAYRQVLAAAQREAVELLEKKGQAIARLTPVPPSWIPRVLDTPNLVFSIAARPMIAIDPHARSSMWDDLEARRATEIEYLQGEIVTLAEALGGDAPVNRALAKLVRTAESGGRRMYPADELKKAVGLA